MQSGYKQQLTDRFVELVEHLNQHLHCRPMDEWEGLDLTIPQIKTLALLQDQGPMRMGNISNSLGSALSATTNIVDRLVDKSLVERVPDQDDRRVVNCQLTAQGRDAMEQFWRIGRMRILEVVDQLEAGQLQRVVEGFELLCGAVDELRTAPTPEQPAT